MRKDLIIVDDFYNNPDQVREAALSLPFNVPGNYPGLRTTPLTNDSTKNLIEQILGLKVTNWFDKTSGCFQLCNAYERSWVHSDFHNDYAAIVYLTPDAPLGSGTSILRHKETGTYGSKGTGEDMVDLKGNKVFGDGIQPSHFSDIHQWETVDKVGNKFNRLIIFNGSLWHISDPYFGDAAENSRLFQLFFMSVRK